MNYFIVVVVNSLNNFLTSPFIAGVHTEKICDQLLDICIFLVKLLHMQVRRMCVLIVYKLEMPKCREVF